MAAKKKEIRGVPLPGSPAGTQTIVGLHAPEKAKKTQIIAGTPAEAAKELVRTLREEARVI
jgi:electron transfer flavoprotein alpha/beta subunit